MASETNISNLTLATTINDNDNMLIEDAVSSKRVTPEKIAEYVSNKLDYSAITNQISDLDTAFQSQIESVNSSISDISDKIPANATSNNKLVAQSDLHTKQLVYEIDDVTNINKNADFATAMRNIQPILQTGEKVLKAYLANEEAIVSNYKIQENLVIINFVSPGRMRTGLSYIVIFICFYGANDTNNVLEMNGIEVNAAGTTVTDRLNTGWYPKLELYLVDKG